VLSRSHLRQHLLLSAIALFFFRPLSAEAQQMPGSQAESSSSVIVVNIRGADGARTDVQAIITLYTQSGNPVGMGSPISGRMAFSGLPTGRYTLEIVAPGFETLTQTVDLQLPGQHEQLSITLTPKAGGAEAAPSAPPVLAPSAQKELDKALEALRAGKADEAKRRLEKVSRTAPSSPDLNYLWGAYYAQLKDMAKAKEYWQKTLELSPKHAFALAALAQLALGTGDIPGAIGYLGRAADAEPTVWRYQERLAAAYLANSDFDHAASYAVRAIDLGKENASDAQLILAQVALHRTDGPAAIKALQAFLAAQPNAPQAVRARQTLDALQRPAPAPSSVPVTLVPAVAAPSPGPNSTYVTGEFVPPPKWRPPDVDESMPAVESGVACPLEKIEDEAGNRVRDFIGGVNRISATEFVDNELIDSSGFPKERESRKYSYVAAISRIPPAMVDVQEYRNGSGGLADFPQNIASNGLPTLVLVFDPAFRDDYVISCEGLSRWRGKLAWQVHFRQRPDRPARLRGYRINNHSFLVPLRGRAWIATDTYQIVSLETDIVAPMPEIRLKLEHTAIEYAPVQFRKDAQVLWLPQSVEIFFDFHGRRMHRRHHFSDYRLFSVDENQKISDPKAAAIRSDTAATPQ
jgi:tetratricopeptide (TPR) repeat protein